MEAIGGGAVSYERGTLVGSGRTGVLGRVLAHSLFASRRDVRTVSGRARLGREQKPFMQTQDIGLFWWGGNEPRLARCDETRLLRVHEALPLTAGTSQHQMT